MGNLSTNHTYKPLLVPRWSEFTAWGLALILLIVMVITSLDGRKITGGLFPLIILIFFSGIMSFGNWIDRKTYLRINDLAVSYFNGAKEVSIPWNEILKVEIFPGKFGDKIIVSGTMSRFRYQAHGRIKMSEKVSGQVGFEQGAEILETILEKSGLASFECQRADKFVYYSRE